MSDGLSDCMRDKQEKSALYRHTEELKRLRGRVKDLESEMREFIKDPEATEYWKIEFKQLLNQQ